MQQKSIKNIRQDFKNKGIFYTPPKLAKMLKKYITNDPKTVYDPTCGVGNLLRIFDDDVIKYGQELESEQLEYAKEIPNFNGYVGDTLLDDGFKNMQFDCVIANPPFSIKWKPELLKDDERFKAVGVLAPPSKADWAFMCHILYHLKNNGIGAVLEFPGILYRGNKEGKIRKWFVENNFIERIIQIPPNTFEDTSIPTVLLILKKNKTNTNIVFEDLENDLSRNVGFEEIKENDFTLSVSAYVQKQEVKEQVDINALNKKIVDSILYKLKTDIEKIMMLSISFKEDNFYLDDLINGIKEIVYNLENVRCDE